MTTNEFALLQQQITSIQHQQQWMTLWLGCMVVTLTAMAYMMFSRSQLLWVIVSMVSRIHEKICPTSEDGPREQHKD